MTDCNELLYAIGGGLPVECVQRGEDVFEMTLPVQGLDGYGLRFWTSYDGTTWHLSDEGHLSQSLWGVSHEKLASRVSVVAGDLPIEIDDGALTVHLVGETDLENRMIFSTAIEAAVSAWALRLEQSVPSLEATLRDVIAEQLARRDVPTQLNVELPGGSGLKRRFDLAAGTAGQGLLRAADTDDTSYFQRAAELYIVSVNDVRALHSGLSHKFVFAWNPERLREPNPLVIHELEMAGVIPSGGVEEATEALAA